MNIKYHYQYSNNELIYEFENETITVLYIEKELSLDEEEQEIVETETNREEDELDFTGLSDGKMEIYDDETAEFLVDTNIPVNFILSAKKENGILYVELLKWKKPDEEIPSWESEWQEKGVESDGKDSLEE